MRTRLKVFKFILVVILCKVFLIFVSSTIAIWRSSTEPVSSHLVLNPIRNFTILELMGSSDPVQVVKPYTSTVLLKPHWPFLKGGHSKRPFAVIGVISQARHINQRHAIRSTWYKWADDLNIRIFFMIGFHDFRKQELYKILVNEHKTYDDLIIDDFEEGYYRLPGKVLRMLKWFNATYSPENAPRFFIKTDHDVFLQLPNIVTALKNTSYYQNLESLSGCSFERFDTDSTCSISDNVNLPFEQSNPETYFIGGQRLEKAPIESKPDSKWYIDSDEMEKLGWIWKQYPTYANGPCYVISGNAVKPIYEGSFQLPIFPFEDVYVVGMVAYMQLNLHVSHLEEMWLNKVNVCRFIETKLFNGNVLALHPIERPMVMMKLCRRIKACRKNMHSKSSSKSFRKITSSYYVIIIFSLLVFAKCLMTTLRLD